MARREVIRVHSRDLTPEQVKTFRDPTNEYIRYRDGCWLVKEIQENIDTRTGSLTEVFTLTRTGDDNCN